MPSTVATEPRDLNRNGKIDLYEDPAASIDDRIEDLLGQMSIPEKVGLMFHHMTFFNAPFPLSPYIVHQRHACCETHLCNGEPSRWTVYRKRHRPNQLRPPAF